MNERFASILLIFAFAALLALLSVHHQVSSVIAPSGGANGGPTDFAAMRGDAGYMNYNWGPPAAMAYMLPQTSQGGSISPQSFNQLPSCGGC